MTPGRELDALIAQKVMGELPWEIWFDSGQGLTPTHPSGLTYQCQSKAQAESYVKEFSYPTRVMEPFSERYSTDIRAAWKVVEALQEQGKFLSISQVLEDFGRKFLTYRAIVEWFEGGAYEYALATCDEAPRAICLAALKAMEAK